MAAPTALQAVFNAFDKDHNGIIDESELLSAFKQSSKNIFTQDIIKAMMKAVGGTNGVSLEQFVKLSDLLSSTQQAFADSDSDKSGAISCTELGRALLDLGYNLSSAQVSSLLDSVDADKNGQIEYSEFVLLFFNLMHSPL